MKKGVLELSDPLRELSRSCLRDLVAQNCRNAVEQFAGLPADTLVVISQEPWPPLRCSTMPSVYPHIAAIPRLTKLARGPP